MSDRRGDEDDQRFPLQRPAEPPVPAAPAAPTEMGAEPVEVEPEAIEHEIEPEAPAEPEAEPDPPAQITTVGLPELQARTFDYAGPVQVAAPTNWPPPTAPTPMGPPLGERPLPELEPLPPEPEPRVRRHRHPLGIRLLILLVKAVLVFILGSVLWVAIYRFIGPPITLTMIGDAFGGHAITKQWMPLDRIDPSMPRAAIAAEDARFCGHDGFDWQAIGAAAARNAQGDKHIRGGSTISQQTAKNVFLWQGGGYFRKGLEAWFTVLIETIWGKKRIMEVYLNVAETGIGTYGVNAGAQRYFKHDASRLSAQEAAQIAAVLPLPKKRPGIDPSGFTRRYGNSIKSRIGVVRNDDLDSCLR